MKTAEYLDALRSKYKLPSDYALQDLLGVHKQELSRYRRGKSTFGDERAIQVAKLLDIDSSQVLIDMVAERTKCPAAKAVWKRLSKTFGHAASLVFVGFLLTSSYGASLHSFAANNIHYAKYRRRRLIPA